MKVWLDLTGSRYDLFASFYNTGMNLRVPKSKKFIQQVSNYQLLHNGPFTDSVTDKLGVSIWTQI